MKQRTVLVTGASRGLGCEFVRQYAAQGYRVFATSRSPIGASALDEVCRDFPGLIERFSLDVANLQSVAKLQQALRGRTIDILINNAGVWGGEHQTIGDIDYEAWSNAFEVNAIGPFRMIVAFRTNVALSEEKKIVTLTSEMGSIGLGGHGAYAYRSSKAAANRVMRSAAEDLREEGVFVLTIHPGWVRTEMGTEHAPLTPEQSVRSMRRIIGSLDERICGRFLTVDGRELPW